MTVDELQNIFFDRMNKKLANMISLEELPTKEELKKLWDGLTLKDKKLLANSKSRTIDKCIRKILKEK